MTCPDCAAHTAPGARFCDQCGRRLDLLGDGLRVGDRRVVSAVFADLVGYTKLVDELDAEDVREQVDRVFAALAECVVRLGGSLEKFVGDAILAVFGAPVAHDDDAARAATCALEMQGVLPRLAGGRSGPLQLRIGISTGEVVAAFRDVAGTRALALTGDPMTTAARLQGLASPGEILADDATIVGAGNRIQSQRIGEKLLRGQRRPTALHRIVGERRVTAGPIGDGTPLVGRSRELETLAGLFESTARTGRGRAAVVRGEAGVGKSRLLAELEPIARAHGFDWIWLDNVSYGMTAPYRTARCLIDWLAEEREIDAGVLAREILFGPDIDEASARKVAGAVAALARDSNMGGWEAEAPLAPTDPAQLLADLRFVVRRFMSRLVEEQPRCIVVDDLHWTDPSSLPLIEEMVRLAAEIPMVVVAGIRPPIQPAWTSLPHVIFLELPGLDPAASDELGAAVAGAPLEGETASWLHGRTAGNALFIKETVRTLRDAGGFVEGRHGLRLGPSAQHGRLPLTLQALLGARIDALPAEQRSLLEVASVIGMTFPEWLLRELHPDFGEGRELEELSDAGLLQRIDGGEGEARARWQFRHPLFHDAAYGRMLGERRRQLHALLADILSRVQPPVPAAELARHRVAAGDVAAALPLLKQAAAEALLLGATAEAEGFNEAAAALGRQTPIEAYPALVDESVASPAFASLRWGADASAIRLDDPAGDAESSPDQ